MKASALRFLRALPLLIVLPAAILICALALALAVLSWLIFGRRRAAPLRADSCEPPSSFSAPRALAGGRAHSAPFPIPRPSSARAPQSFTTVFRRAGLRSSGEK